MASFTIHTHGRLQEWVAEENGYFAAEGLTDYALSSYGLISPTHARARQWRSFRTTARAPSSCINRAATRRSVVPAIGP